VGHEQTPEKDTAGADHFSFFSSPHPVRLVNRESLRPASFGLGLPNRSAGRPQSALSQRFIPEGNVYRILRWPHAHEYDHQRSTVYESRRAVTGFGFANPFRIAPSSRRGRTASHPFRPAAGHGPKTAWSLLARGFPDSTQALLDNELSRIMRPDRTKGGPMTLKALLDNDVPRIMWRVGTTDGSGFAPGLLRFI
jgi:hypothetical protein